PTPDPTTPDQSPSLQDQILNHIYSLETLIKQHNEKAKTLITPIRLTFGEEGDSRKGKDKGKGPVEEVDDDLKTPYKEVLKSPFTGRIIEFSAPSHRMPINLKIYNGSTDPDDHITRFVEQLTKGSRRCRYEVCGKVCLEKKMQQRFNRSLKVVRRANETLPDFKERWTEQMRYIQGVPEVMQISAFMSDSKYPELARRFADRVPQTVIEMMKRVDDFIKSEEAYKSIELPKGDHPERGHGTSYRGPRPPRIMQSGGPPKVDGYNTYNRRDHYQSYVSPRQQGRRQNDSAAKELKKLL
nr:reverse transcriptase domain-containing protein [Tanacetum cinerariifolium]